MTRPPPPSTAPRPGSTANRVPADGNGDGRPAASTLGSRPEPVRADDGIHLEVLDGAVRGIFSVALTVSAARSLTEGPAATRLDQALEKLDDLVRELRHTALTARLAGTRSPPRIQPAERTPAERTPAERVHDLVGQAADALTKVDGVLMRLWVDACADTGGDDPDALDRLTKAAQLVYLARVTLTATETS